MEKQFKTVPLYITYEEVVDYYNLTLNADKLKEAEMYIRISNDRINVLSGGKINKNGFMNFNLETRSQIRLATGRYFLWLINQGQAWFVGNVSISTEGFSYSQSEATEPDYILKEIRQFLQIANLLKRNDIFNQGLFDSQNDDDFLPSYYPDCDRYINYRQGNRTYIRKDNFFLNNNRLKATYNDQGDAILNINIETPSNQNFYNFLNSDFLTATKTEPTPNNFNIKYNLITDLILLTQDLPNLITINGNEELIFTKTQTTKGLIFNAELNKDNLIIKNDLQNLINITSANDDINFTKTITNKTINIITTLNEEIFLKNKNISTPPSPNPNSTIYSIFKKADNNKLSVQVNNPTTPSSGGIIKSTPWITVPTSGNFLLFPNFINSLNNTFIPNEEDYINTNAELFDFISDHGGNIKIIIEGKNTSATDPYSLYIEFGINNSVFRVITTDDGITQLEIINFNGTQSSPQLMIKTTEASLQDAYLEVTAPGEFIINQLTKIRVEIINPPI